MKLHLLGHDYKYAVEQIMLALFPGEKPDYSSDFIPGSSELIAESRLSLSKTYAHSTTVIRCDGKVSRSCARIRRDKLIGKLVTDRLLRRIIILSFYRAAIRFLDAPPVWGSLTGIRPAHLAAVEIESGLSAGSATKKLMRKYYVSPERAFMCIDAAKASIKLKRTLNKGDVALYVGIPFCPTRCAYCSFVSNSVEKSFGLIEAFVKTLLMEIDAAAKVAADIGLRVVSTYIGGGTPTALPPESLEAVMSALKASFDFSHLREYTVEAGRPETVSSQKLEIAYRFGADRICVNPQSMSSEVLSAIGRRHTPEDVFDAVRRVREGSAALNMDVIAGLPGDTACGFRRTLDTILGFEPENITVHTLSLKKGSRIMLDGTSTPQGPEVSQMLDYASHRLRENGYSPYYLYRQKYTSGGFENTGWCLPGHEGIYNVCMMEELCPVLALGGGGVTKLVSPGGRIERIFNAKYPREYVLHSGKIDDKIDRIKDFFVMEEC